MGVLKCMECDNGQYKMQNLQCICNKCKHTVDATNFLIMTMKLKLKKYNTMLETARKLKLEAYTKQDTSTYYKALGYESQIKELITETNSMLNILEE